MMWPAGGFLAGRFRCAEIVTAGVPGFGLAVERVEVQLERAVGGSSHGDGGQVGDEVVGRT